MSYQDNYRSQRVDESILNGVWESNDVPKYFQQIRDALDSTRYYTDVMARNGEEDYPGPDHPIQPHYQQVLDEFETLNSNFQDLEKYFGFGGGDPNIEKISKIHVERGTGRGLLKVGKEIWNDAGTIWNIFKESFGWIIRTYVALLMSAHWIFLAAVFTWDGRLVEQYLKEALGGRFDTDTTSFWCAWISRLQSRFIRPLSSNQFPIYTYTFQSQYAWSDFADDANALVSTWLLATVIGLTWVTLLFNFFKSCRKGVNLFR